jgi:WD40 repeat protein
VPTVAEEAVAFSPDGYWLATGSGTKIWEASSGRQLYVLDPDSTVQAMVFSPDRRWLATGTDGNRAVLWALIPPSPAT